MASSLFASEGVDVFAFSVGFHSSEASAPAAFSENSQTMNVLTASNNPKVNGSIGGGDIVIVDDRALLGTGGASQQTEDSSDEENFNQNGEISIYVVREGDTVSQIAALFGVTTNTVRWANDISSDGVIHEGQTLVILPVTGVQHTVEEGDTVASIAEEYDGKEKEILQYNYLSSAEELTVGSEVVIPHGEIAPEVSSGTPSQLTGNSAPASSEGYFIKPISSYVRTQGLHGYNAVDLAASRGSSVYAAASGQVIVSRNSGWNGGYGKYVVIKHPNGSQTLYSHMSQVIVGVGSVVRGQVIGYVGSTGRSTGNHLHFEVRGAQNPF